MNRHFAGTHALIRSFAIPAALSLVSMFAPQTATAADIRGTHCELFILKAGGHQTAYHGAFGAIINAQMFLKVDLAQVPDVRKVAFYGTTRQIDNAGTVLSETGFREVELPRFFASADTFVFDMGDLENHWWDSTNSTPRTEHEGAFFVEKANGDRLWANPSAEYGPHYLFDELTVASLRSTKAIYIPTGYPYGAAVRVGVDSLPLTADTNTYLNPLRCR